MELVASLIVAGIATVVEAGLFVAKPAWLARLAVIPIGLRRVVELPSKLRGELAVASASPGYRDAPAKLNPARLASALATRNWDLVDATVVIEPAGWVLVRISPRPRSYRVINLRPRALARITATPRGETLVLRAGYAPVPFVGLGALFAAIALSGPFDPRSVIVATVMWMIFVAAAGILNRPRVREALDSVEDTLTDAG